MLTNLLIVSPSFYPATVFGGPVFYLRDLCAALSKFAPLRVVTTDTSGPCATMRLDKRKLESVFCYPIEYCPKTYGNAFSMAMLVRLFVAIPKHDIVHLHGVFNFPTFPVLLIAGLFRKPIVWSMHGSLQGWDNTNKRWLKYGWLSIARLLCKMLPSIRILCTSKDERHESLTLMPSFEHVVIPIGVHVPEGEMQKCDAIPMKLMFIARVHPIKNLESLIRAVSLIGYKGVQLNIYGDGETSYVDSLKSLIKELGCENNVVWHGHVTDQQKAIAFSSNHILVLPSQRENFGIVVGEALAHCVPVIVSKGAPWADVEKHGCGLWVDNTPESLATAICKMQTMDLAEMGRLGREWMKRDFSWENVAKEMVKVYEKLTMGNRK